MFNLFGGDIELTEDEKIKLELANKEAQNIINSNKTYTVDSNNTNSNNNNNKLSKTSQARRDKFYKLASQLKDLKDNNNSELPIIEKTTLDKLKPAFYAIGFICTNNPKKHKIYNGTEGINILVNAYNNILEFQHFLANGRYDKPVFIQFNIIHTTRNTKKGLINVKTLDTSVIYSIKSNSDIIYRNRELTSSAFTKVLPSQIEQNNDRFCGYQGMRRTKVKMSTGTVKASDIQNIDVKLLQRKSRKFKIEEFKPESDFIVKLNSQGKILLGEFNNTGYHDLTYVAELDTLTLNINETEKGKEETVTFQWQYYRDINIPVSFWSRFGTLTDAISNFINGYYRSKDFIDTVKQILIDKRIEMSVKESYNPADIKENNTHIPKSGKNLKPSISESRKYAKKASKQAKNKTKKVKSSGF